MAVGGRGRVETGEREEDVVAVGHVAVLRAVQKSLHDARLRVTHDSHCSRPTHTHTHISTHVMFLGGFSIK